jgi:hypothetical protein
MGLPAYYGRPALVAGYFRQSAPVSVQVVVFVQFLAAALCLASAVVVGGVAGGVLHWPDAVQPGPQIRQAVVQRGPAIAIAFGLVGLVFLIVAGSLRRGRQWSRVLMLAVSAATIAATLYTVYRGAQVNAAWFWPAVPGHAMAGLTVPAVLVLALCTRSARSWFRWGSY